MDTFRKCFVTKKKKLLMVLSNYTPLHQVIVQALDIEGMDMEIDLSNLGTVNTMFAALFRWYLTW